MRAVRVNALPCLCLVLALAAGCRGGPPPTAPHVANSAGPVSLPPAGVDEPPAEATSEPQSLSSARLTTLDEDLAGPVERIKRLFRPAPDERIARQSFQEGEELFRNRQYADAAAQYKIAARRWPDSTLEEDAMFMVGECHFFADRYPKANDAYSNLLKKYDNSRHLDRVVARQFAIARFWEQLDRAKPKAVISPNLLDPARPMFDTTGNALATYESVHLNDPTGPLADDSVMATGNAYFLDERFEDADHYYGILRRDYPKSEHQKNAHVLGLRSKLRKYQGAHYDGAPLKEADELIGQMDIQFAQAPEERERIVRAKEAVRAQQAQRDFEMAEYYTRRGRAGAARFYYNQVTEQYPDTRFAELARQQLGTIKELPDVPPQRLPWLANLFTSERHRR